jgi:hypothetical protein
MLLSLTLKERLRTIKRPRFRLVGLAGLDPYNTADNVVPKNNMQVKEDSTINIWNTLIPSMSKLHQNECHLRSVKIAHKKVVTFTLIIIILHYQILFK